MEIIIFPVKFVKLIDMASYTDIIPQFTPYVQEAPVQALVEVGMEKQRRYDEGIQRIQSYIDNVAGLAVIRDVDKAYLQSKLNELGGKLKTVAAGDFSNFQLVNSVSGMANQVVKDRAVQNAVSSTAWYQKQFAEMEKAISEGKSSQANIDDFNEKASAWLNSNDVNQQFRDRYTPYTDVKKKAMEAIKALHPNLQKYDIPFEVTNGKINTKAIANAMQSYKIEGIDENQIAQAIYASFTPDDMNQLAIDAKYRFKGVNSDQLISVAQRNYNSQKQQAVSDLAFLREQKGVVTDPNESSKIDQRISDYERLLGLDGKAGQLDENLASQIELATNNPNAAKLSIYKDGFVKEFANAFSWKNQEMEYKTNPLKQQENWLAEQRRKAYEFNERLKIDKVQLQIATEKLKLDAEANALKRAELYGDPTASDWTDLGNETDNVLKSPELYSKHVVSVDDAINGDRARLKTKYSDAQINEMLADWQNAQGVVSKAKKVKPDALNLIKNIAKNTNYLQSLQTLERRLKTEADNEAGVSNVIAQNVAGKSALNINFGGQRFNLSPTEILELQAATKETTRGSKQGTIREVNVDTSRLNSNQIKFVNSMRGVLYGTFEPGKSNRAFDPIRSQVGKVFSEYNKPAQSLKSVLNKSSEIYKQKLAPLAQEFVPKIKAITASKDGSPPPIIVSRLSQLLTATDVKNIAGDENFDLETASSMLESKNAKDTRVFIYQDGDNYQVHLKSESNPKERQVLKLSKADIIRYFGPGYVNDRTQESIRMNMGRGNSNITQNPTQAMMQKQFGDFPGINRLQVTADLNQDLSDPDLYSVMINVKKKNGRYQTFELSGQNGEQRVGFDQGRKNLNSLTDDVLLKRLKQEYPNFDFSTLDY